MVPIRDFFLFSSYVAYTGAALVTARCSDYMLEVHF